MSGEPSYCQLAISLDHWSICQTSGTLLSSEEAHHYPIVPVQSIGLWPSVMCKLFSSPRMRKPFSHVGQETKLSELRCSDMLAYIYSSPMYAGQF